jgi:hypothetical protein
MVQLKYFGDSRDFFKYDLITKVVEEVKTPCYAFIPMLTSHRDDNEGNKRPQMIGGKSEALLEFIRDCEPKSLNHWRAWLGNRVNYRVAEPVDNNVFADDTREMYWEANIPLLRAKNALIFLDPDTGLQTGTKGYLEKMGREKYILQHEIELLRCCLDPSSILMVYQHLPNNKHIHEKSVEKKMAQLRASSKASQVCAYREDDLAFLFMTKNYALCNRLYSTLEKYHQESGHPQKSIHPAVA